MAGVALHHVTKRFGQATVVDRVDIEVADGKLCVIVGPSGCGKSTILRLVAGLEEVSAGSVLIGGREVTRLPPARRRVAMVFQSYALYPHMTVADNIAFGLRTIGADKARIEERLRHAAAMLQLESLLDRKPAQLSGGERQRVAIGRAIVREPDVFLLDEPLSNLDAGLRAHMRVELQALHRDLGVTMIYVTHDQVEAMTMADQIVVMNEGRIEQAGAPLELYERPANLFVAGFIGSPRMNLVPARVGRIVERAVEIMLGDDVPLRLPVAGDGLEAGMPVTLGVRPEHVALAEAPQAIPAVVEVVEHLGAETIVHALAAGHTLAARLGGIAALKPGDRISLALPPAACHLFLPEGSRAAPAGTPV